MMRLKELRIKNGLNQKELAEKMGYRQNTISQWENGQRTIDADTLIKLAGFYGVSTDYILGRPTGKSDKDDPLQNRLIVIFNALNDIGKNEAIKRVLELTELPRYRKGNCADSIPIAAHNDTVIDEKELKLMQEDIDEL